MSMLSNLDLIRRVPLFSMLTQEQATSIAGLVAKHRFKKGESIVVHGEMSNALYVILAGRARVLNADEKGREVILATLGVGDYFGEMSLIDNLAHSATVVAEVQSDVLELGRADFARCLHENRSMALTIMRGLVQRLRSADQKIESLALMDVYGRVAQVLKDSAVANERGVLIIRDKVSRQDVAKMVGASREMVSRVMKDFIETGFLQTLEDGSLRLSERRLEPR
jgi:CRP/FNR family cyclic AMP-dependent transcriptional regulator